MTGRSEDVLIESVGLSAGLRAASIATVRSEVINESMFPPIHSTRVVPQATMKRIAIKKPHGITRMKANALGDE